MVAEDIKSRGRAQLGSREICAAHCARCGLSSYNIIGMFPFCRLRSLVLAARVLSLAGSSLRPSCFSPSAPPCSYQTLCRYDLAR
jgi:hypothetical protein